MKVGTDGALLGAWAPCSENTQRVLDIGTGTGLIALMIAQRAPNAHITAIEPNPDALKDAQANFEESPFAERLHLMPCRLQDFSSAEDFDLIVSNPPFYTQGTRPEHHGRAHARHNMDLSAHQLLSSAGMLAQGGRIAAIYPPEIFGDLISLAPKLGLQLSHRCDVRPLAGKNVHRVLFSFEKNSGKSIDPKRKELIIEADTRHSYSHEFKHLLKDYYLHL